MVQMSDNAISCQIERNGGREPPRMRQRERARDAAVAEDQRLVFLA